MRLLYVPCEIGLDHRSILGRVANQEKGNSRMVLRHSCARCELAAISGRTIVHALRARNLELELLTSVHLHNNLLTYLSPLEERGVFRAIGEVQDVVRHGAFEPGSYP